MAWVVRNNKETVESKKLKPNEIQSLNDQTRLKIMKKLGKKSSYPAKIAKQLNIPKQKAYYHFKILEENQLIKKEKTEERSGGIATYYKPVKPSFHIDLETKGTKTNFQPQQENQFLQPLIQNGEIQGKIVVGSPDEHGPDQVRARDGHLAGEIALTLGKYGQTQKPLVRLDTEIHNSQSFQQNMVMIGGILTNTVVRKFNEEFPVSFEDKQFPYRGFETPKNKYTDATTGFIAKTENPEQEGKYIYIVAGIESGGTRAAVEAFQDLDQLFEQSQSYTVIKGKDMDGDGEIDDYEVLEKE